MAQPSQPFEGQTRTNRRTGQVDTFQGGQWVTTSPPQQGGQPAQGGGQGYQIQQMITPAEQRQREEAARSAAVEAERLRMAQAEEARRAAEFERESQDADRELASTADQDAIRQAAQDDIFRRTEVVLDALDQALEMIDSSTTGVGSVFSGLPGSRARDLDALLNTIRGNIGLDELQRLRDASTTGASGLGSLTAPELALLTAIRGSIDQGQSPEQMRESLGSIRTQLWEARNTRLQAMGQEPMLDTRSLEAEPGVAGEDGEQVIGAGVINRNGRAINSRTGEDLGPFEEWAASIPDLSPEDRLALSQTATASGDAERRLESAPGILRQFNQGATFGFGDEIDARGAQLETMAGNAVRRLRGEEIPYTSGQAYEAVVGANRQGDEQFVERYPVTSLGANILGGVVAPGAGAAGRFVGSADNVLSGFGRGAGVGGGTGLAYGMGTGEGDIGERFIQGLPEAATGAALGGPLGAVFARSGGPRRTRDVETLVNEGVTLTPGTERGGGVQALENLGARTPILGPAIRGAWSRSADSLERAGWNRSLSPIGQSLPEEGQLGSDAVNYTRDIIGREFDRAASFVPDGSTADETFNQAVQRLRDRASSELGGEELAAFNRELDNRIGRLSGASFSGPQLRQVDREIGELGFSYANSQNPAQQPLGRLLGETQDEIRNLMGRLSPEARQTLDRANPAWRQYLVMERAVQRGGGAPLTPARFSQAVSDVSGGVRTNAVARDTAPLGDLSRASWVMRGTMGDSGSPDAAAGLGLMAYTASDPLGGLAVGAGLSAAAAAYARMGQRITQQLPRNATPQDIQRASSELEGLARQAPPEARSALEELRRNLWAGAGNLSGRAGQGSQALTAQYEDR